MEFNLHLCELEMNMFVRCLECLSQEQVLFFQKLVFIIKGREKKHHWSIILNNFMWSTVTHLVLRWDKLGIEREIKFNVFSTTAVICLIRFYFIF